MAVHSFILKYLQEAYNVKPELLLEAFYRYLELPYNEMQFQIHRVDVYARKEDGTLIALDEMGDDILE